MNDDKAVRNPKVSILTPCYNVERYIGKFLDSILAQNYQPIELIIVNDGSTDGTENIIDAYRSKFRQHQISFRYCYKENGGQASAIALGIKYVTGDYLIWPDSDDFLLPMSIKKRVEYLETHPECGIVRSNGYLYNEDDLTNPKGTISRLNRECTFEDFILFKVPWCPGCYMIRMALFDIVNPKREIFISKCGQNIQMLLPVCYKSNCAYLNDFLFAYVIHPKSHSHSIKKYEDQVIQIGRLEECVEKTLAIIEGNTFDSLEKNRLFFNRTRYQLAWKYSKKEELIQIYEILKKQGCVRMQEKVMKIFAYSQPIEFLLKIIGKLQGD